jgi:arginyl-tRNA synthetase
MIRTRLLNLIQEAIKTSQREGVFPEFVLPKIIIEHPKDTLHGDYATNIALEIGKVLKKKPMEIANTLRAKLEVLGISPLKDIKLFKKIEIAKPGFINFFLSESVLINELKKILKEKENYGFSKIDKGKNVVIDYSSPNIAKPFGVGHLRSTIIGQALYNIYKFLGWQCIGDNHLGDWGTQFGKMIVAIKKWVKKEKIKDLSIADLEELYVRFHKEIESHPEIEEEARAWFKKLEDKNEEAEKIWWACVDISLKEFNKIYELLDIKIDNALGESFYQGKMKPIIDEAIKKKIALESEKALIIKYPQKDLPPAMILKSDGATTYLTRDLATVKYRLENWKPDLIIYEVGAEQALHFKQLFETVELLGWAKKEKFFHVAHGLYRTKAGKFSTRKGETIHLESILKEAIERARKIIEGSETGKDLSEEEKEKIAKAVGIGAVKYNDLSQHYSKDIIFDWDKILNLKGNSSPYLQYTFARCTSIINKAKPEIDFERAKKINPNSEEKDILRTIYKFPEVVQESAEKFSPNLICNFAFDLAQKYNLFYQLHPVIKAKTKELKSFRLFLTTAVAQLLKNSLAILGISAPEKM